MPGAELLSTRVTASLRQLPRGNARGAALLSGLVLVMLMTLLGVALFEMSTIETSLARRDASETQAFYCAEAQAARIYGLYDPAQATSAKLGPLTLPRTLLPLADGTYVLTGSAALDATGRVVTVTATCALPDGRTRTVQRHGTRGYPTPGQRDEPALSPAILGPWKDCGSNPLCQ